MTEQEQIKEIDKQSERRINYCVRIQEAFNYKGNYDHEDIPSILVDFEREIKNDILPEDSVVLSREEKQEYENLVKLLIYDKPIKSRVYEVVKDIKEQASKETAEKIFAKIFEDFNIDCGTYSINMARKKYMNAQLEQTTTALRKRFSQLAKQFGVRVEE